MTKLNLEHISIEGFRGFNGKQDFDFHKNLNIITGENGTGKTSLLDAIEWCLFGNIAYMKGKEYTKVRDEIINDFHQNEEAKVTIILQGEGVNPTEITRTTKKGKKKTHLKLMYEGKITKDNEAQEIVEDLLKLGFEDFYRGIYLHQIALLELVTGDPAARDESMDRLLGIEDLRALSKSIPPKSVKDVIKNLQNEIERLESKEKELINYLEDQINKKSIKAEELGIKREEISPDLLKDLWLGFISVLEEISTQFLRDINELDTLKSVEITDTQAKEIAKRILNEVETPTGTVFQEIEECHSKILRLKSIKDRVNQFKTEIETIEEQIAGIITKHGDTQQLKEKIEFYETKVNDLKNELNAQNTLLRILKDARLFLESGDIVTCPVCEQGIQTSSLLPHLLNRLSEFQEHRTIDMLNTEINKAKDKAEEIRTITNTLEELRTRRKNTKGRFRDEITKLNEIITRQVGEDEDIEGIITKETENVEEQIKNANERSGKLENKLRESKTKFEKIELLLEILDLQKSLSQEKNKMKETEEQIQKLKDKKDKVANLFDHLKKIEKATLDVQMKLADQIIESITPQIVENFNQLCGHPSYNEIQIACRQEKVGRVIKNAYTIEGVNKPENRVTPVRTRFSQAQMTGAALSVFFGLANISKSNLGLIMFDDPSQTLDQEFTQNLAKMIREKGKNIQIIIATPDEYLHEQLLKEITDAKRFSFSNWGNQGPHIAFS